LRLPAVALGAAAVAERPDRVRQPRVVVFVVVLPVDRLHDVDLLTAVRGHGRSSTGIDLPTDTIGHPSGAGQPHLAEIPDRAALVEVGFGLRSPHGATRV